MQPAHTFHWEHIFENQRFRVLFVDDNVYALKSVQKILERAGYKVFTATTRDEALDIIANIHIHLGIFDLNLARENETGDTQPQNREGLDLAVNPDFPLLRMVYTGEEDYQVVVETLEHPQAVNYIVKGDDSEAELLEKVQLALAERLPLNQDLFLFWDHTSLQEMIQTIYPELSLAQQMEHIIELDDLFRIQFFGVGSDLFQQISIQMMPVEKLGRVWLRVSGYTKRGRRYDYLTLCGRRDFVINEAEQFDKLSTRSHLMRTPLAQTVHYGLHAYEIFEDSLYEINPLRDYLRAGDDAFVADCLDTLHTGRFQRRYQHHITREPGTLYQLALGTQQNLAWKSTEDLFQIVTRLLDEWQQSMPHVHLEVNQNELIYGIGRERQSYPQPIIHLETLGNYEVTRPVGITHGDLRLDTIFAQAGTGDIHLYDFADSRSSSVLRDYVTLERSIHLEILSRVDIADYQLLAEALNGTESELTSAPNIQRAIYHIRQIRQLAIRDINCGLEDYLQDLYIDFMTYLLTYPAHGFAGYVNVRRYTHCFVFAGQICHDLQQLGALTLNEQNHGDGVWLDANKFMLRRLGNSVELTEKQFGIFELLYNNINQEISYADIIEKGLHEEFLHDNIELEKPRIQTAVSRLRPKLQSFGFEIEAGREGYSLKRTD